MNYDKAHDLAHAMRESEEYKELMQAQEAVKADAEATALVRTFMAQQMQWEYAKLSGAPEADDLQKKQEELMPQIQANTVPLIICKRKCVGAKYLMIFIKSLANQSLRG